MGNVSETCRRYRIAQTRHDGWKNAEPKAGGRAHISSGRDLRHSHPRPLLPQYGEIGISIRKKDEV